jgi:hypothetical protein
MALSSRERAWLDYAHDVVCCEKDHLNTSRGQRKSYFADQGLDDRVRWPGNLGSEYELAPLRVLCLAQIHNDRRLGASMQEFQRDLLRFLSAQCRPEAFLRRCRVTYQATIPTWGPWSRFAEILDATGVSLAVGDVVYANVAKCWAPASRRGEAPDNQKTMRLCNKRFLISRLVKIVDPEFIIQVGVCDALNDDDFGGRYREVLNNNSRPDSRAGLQAAKARVREKYRSRFP